MRRWAHEPLRVACQEARLAPHDAGDRMSLFRIWWVYVRLGVLNEMRYRTNFFIQVFRTLLDLAGSMVTLATVFAHTETLGGWRPPELLAVVGVFFLIGGVIRLVIQPGMQRLMADVREGTLDFTLTKPEDAQVLVSVREVQVWRLLDVLLGVGVLAVAVAQIGQNVGPAQAAAFAVALLSGTAIVYSFWLVLATCCFWMVRVDNIMVIFQSMYEAGRWPVGIYPRWLRSALTFVVPVALATTVPAEALAGRLTGTGLFGVVITAVLMLVLSRWFWRFGVRHYSGASA